jgi:cytochrome c-type biogenesis protein CcsB
VTGLDKYVKTASLMTLLGFVANTVAGGHRWYSAGHPPFASVYEMLLSFVWTVAGLTLIAERKYKVRVIGSVTMPLAVVGVVLMQLLPNEVRPLVPALQSTWLHIHVTLAMLAYAACALSFAVAMMFLIQDNMKTETFQAFTSALVSAIYIAIVAARFDHGGLALIGWDFQNKEEIFLQRGVRLFVSVPDLGWLFAIVTVAVAAPLLFYIVAYRDRLRVQLKVFPRRVRNFVLFWRPAKPVVVAEEKIYEPWVTTASRGVALSIALQVLALAFFVLRARNGFYHSADAEGVFQTSLAASPFILAGLVSGIFASLLYLMMVWRRADLERLLPTAETLDRITYKTIGIAFPLLTLMIAAGAYWANRTWGSYWSWDPKETWAAITWLVYAGYLHMRITRGWRGRRAAYFAILGFAVVMFTFFGVTYLLPGLHAYA